VRKLRLSLVILISSLLYLVGSSMAQEGGLLPGETLSQPKERPVTVSATVPDREPPASAILVSPENNQFINTRRPQLRWRFDADTTGISKQQLFIDGTLFQDDIPLIAHTNNEYVLDYTTLVDIYGLTHTTSLTDGVHTWKIRVYDENGNSSESATWTFTIDTLAPVFVITKIVDETTSISAQDVSTIPETPFEIPTRNPILIGIGEANASVDVNVRLPSGEIEAHAFVIDQNGKWTIQLFDLPRGVIIFLDFTISDAVGHISTLVDLPLLVTKLSIFVPGLTQPVVITPPEMLEPIVEPLLQPQQIVEKIVYSPLAGELPSSLQTASETLPFVLQKPTQDFLLGLISFLGLILISLLPATKILILLSRFGKLLTPHIFYEILQAIGLLPSDSPHGIVFDVETQAPVSFATIQFQGKTKDGILFGQTKLSNKEGLYSYHQLPEGVFQASALADNFRFPTLEPVPSGFFWTNFYRGNTFENTNEAITPSLFLPLDADVQQRHVVRNTILKMPARNTPTLLTVVAIALLIPSLYNLVAVLIFLVAYLNRKWRSEQIRLQVCDQGGSPLMHTVLRIQLADEPRVRDLTQTDQHGIAKLYNTPLNSSVLVTALQAGYEIQNSTNKDTLETTMQNKQVQLKLCQAPKKL